MPVNQLPHPGAHRTKRCRQPTEQVRKLKCHQRQFLLRRRSSAARYLAGPATTQQDYGADRAFGLRQIDLPAHSEPHQRNHPQLRAWKARSCWTARMSHAMDVTSLRRRVGMVFQRPNPFPKSIFDNIAYGCGSTAWLRAGDARPGGAQPAARRAVGRSEGQAARIGLRAFRRQQQRLCIARALAVDPEVLLLDEPCSALDPIATAKIEELHVRPEGSVHHGHRDP